MRTYCALQMEFGCYDKDSGEVECYVEIHLVSAANPEAAGCVERFATFMSLLLVIITFPFSLFECFKVVQEFERAVIFRLGRLRKGGARGPGLFFVLPCIDTYRKVDLRTVSFDVPPQEVLTRDSVTVAVDAVVYYRIKEPLNAVVRVADYSASTRLLAATTLRNVLGMRDLAQLLSDREAISHMMQANLDEATDPWGVEVERVEIKDVILPFELQKAMAAEAEGSRIAKSKIIEAEGEIKAAENLRDASKIMMENPKAMLIGGGRLSRFHSLQKTLKRDHQIFSSLVFNLTKISRQFERAVILRNGKVHKNKAFGPGLLFYLPCVDSVKFIDLRTFCYEVPPQEALTKDSLTVSVDAVVFYKVFEPVWAVINVNNYRIATQFLASTTLRNALGTTKLSDVLINRPVISKQVLELMKNTTKEWGVKVVKVEIKDIRLPLQLQKAMAAEAESTRLANAKIIVAKSEIETIRNLQVATTLLMENPMASLSTILAIDCRRRNAHNCIPIFI
ncbi:uncharacterized protein LOC123708960 isoform X2 [Pieris brassicae]|uniref:uncharacterized protein LOC123708960 isoform X2 n=1 Tax=Pieris brassicae TaxID=7116 RepID=UPI001E66088F|nr:uncharacterized protein LOC123708960 isoform X2 [Pieris brassicae]